jgi:hypothetical protein
MSNETCSHGNPTNICERIHVGDVVKVVIEQVGYMTVGEVLAISPLGGITVRFPDGAMNAEEYGLTQEETEIMHYIESELDVVTA